MADASVSKTAEVTRVGSNPTARTKRDVAELADATVLGAVAARRVGSSPTISTIRGVAELAYASGLKPDSERIVGSNPTAPTTFVQGGQRCFTRLRYRKVTRTPLLRVAGRLKFG